MIKFHQLLHYKLILMKKNRNSNQTKESSRNKFRQSLSILSSQLIRNSFSEDCKIPNLYRQSYATISKPRQTMNVPSISLCRRSEPINKQQKQNMITQLKFTLNGLQKKINLAKHKLNSYKNILEVEEDEENEDRPHEIFMVGQQNQSIFGLGSTHVQSRSKITFGAKQKNQKKYFKIKTFYLTHLISALEGENNRALEHLSLSLKIFQNCHKINSPSFSQLEEKKICFPRYKEDIGKKTLVIDIDETIIHCQQNDKNPYDIILPIEVQSGAIAKAYITIRPYAISFLKRMSKHYEIIAFTASHQSYADIVLNQLDPERQYIKHRLYRKNCVQIYQNIYAKDLRIINRDLHSMVLIDNAPYSYIFQLQNGIPILPYYSGEDNQLLLLQKYLFQMVKCEDVREYNKKYFKLHKYKEYREVNTMVEDLFFNQM